MATPQGQLDPKVHDATPAPVRERTHFRVWAGLALVMAAAVWLHVPSLRTPLFADDYFFVELVRGHSLTDLLLHPDPANNFYRPVGREIYFWCVSRALGTRPEVFHLVNLGLFLAVLALLFVVVRRLAGARAALVAAAFLSLHYAVDLPMRWAAGSQDLLAVLGGLGALLLHLRGRRWWAAAALMAGLLSKEIVVLVPLIAVAADRLSGERWRTALRRAWPLGAAVALWAGLVAWAAPHARGEVVLTASGPLAALVHLVQVGVGLEWGADGLRHWLRTPPPPGPLALVLVALLWAIPAAAPRRAGRPAGIGIAWALLAALPIAAVAIIWSAYYYLFAMCGVALALGAWLANRARVWAALAVALLAWGSAGAVTVNETATARDPWTVQSHINRAYVERATHYGGRYIADLKRMHPEFPPHSTLFFAGLPGNIGFQVADGPGLRVVYRDSTLRSFYLSRFSAVHATRGPMFFFMAQGDSLREIGTDPDGLYPVALGLIVCDKLAAAHDVLEVERSRGHDPARADYWSAWVKLARGDSTGAREALERAGVAPGAAAAGEVTRALAEFGAGDTLAALSRMRRAITIQGRCAPAHALLADLELSRDPRSPAGVIEALAARSLDPGSAMDWRRWAMIQMQARQYPQALSSLNRYTALAGAEAAHDREAQHWKEDLIRLAGDAAH